ncbi:rhodanese-like domain-containing protein [Thermonema rossianum]|uniref:rhodanese-like domain-containing protein n=1 Tax=Thermonema rossianum TaxID=55505 RepID=UPI0008FFD9B4|nr:rhodanese-like domain-containing protein [Thermonema rossianum]
MDTQLPCIEVEEFCRRRQAHKLPPVLDVREQWEYEEYHLPEAKHIPLPELLFRLDEIDAWRDKEIIVHCRSGMRGYQAQKLLLQCGFQKVLNLRGGIEAFIDYITSQKDEEAR